MTKVFFKKNVRLRVIWRTNLHSTHSSQSLAQANDKQRNHICGSDSEPNGQQTFKGALVVLGKTFCFTLLICGGPSSSVLGPYFPLRTACLFTYGKKIKIFLSL